MKVKVFLSTCALLMLPTPADAQVDWDALAECESNGGRASGNIYQFTQETWRKVGPTARPEDATPAQQKAAAEEWASRVDPGSTAGWPSCWPGGKVGVRSTPSPREHDPAPIATPQRGTRGTFTGFIGVL